MIGLIGIKNNVDVTEREKLSIPAWKIKNALRSILKECVEAVIISTCNRTEIYFETEYINEEKSCKVYGALGWTDENIRNTFVITGPEVARHLLEVVCGFHSKILGEDQILGQIKNGYEISLGENGIKNELQRLFQNAITCGKEFRLKSEISKIPISSASMVAREARKRRVRKFMILGFGEVGQLTAKYIMDGEFDVLYIAVRDTTKVIINDNKVQVIAFEERKSHYCEVDCIISCTSSPHTVVRKQDLPSKEFIVFDLALPRDVEKGISEMDNIQLFDIDSISMLQDENAVKRRTQMENNKNILEKYFKEYVAWVRIKDILPSIEEIKSAGQIVHMERFQSFKNKRNTKDELQLAYTLLKSTSNFYVNNAIEVLKEDYLRGKGNESLEIINRIFKI